MLPDIINATFEAAGSLFILNHCITLYRDKLVRGVSIISTAFFCLWGCWNAWFYLHLAQKFSWYAAMVLTLVNFVYIGMMIFYKRKEKYGALESQSN